MNTKQDLRRRTVGVPITETSIETNIQRSSTRISRIINSSKWIILAGWIFWYFEVDKGVQEILSLDGWVKILFYISTISLLSMFFIFFYLQYFLPLMKGTPPPKYSTSTWRHDKTLGKFIPIATITGTFGVIGMIIDFCNIWGFFGAFIIVIGLLRGIFAFLDIFS